MATILIQSYAINEVTRFGVTINLHLAGDNPLPPEKIEATKIAEVRKAFDAYVERARATGKPIQVSAICRRGRSPVGFDAIKDVNVNI